MQVMGQCETYSFQPVGQWMGYSFADLGAEGCCRSLNALLWMFSQFFFYEAKHSIGHIIQMVGPIDMEQKIIQQMDAGLIVWSAPFTSPMTLTLDFRGQIFK